MCSGLSQETGVCWKHVWHPRALGPASGSQTQTAHGKAGFAKWPNRVRGRLGPRTGGSHTRPRSQPHLGPVCCHSPMTLCSLGPVCAGRGWRPAEQCPARHPACVCSLPPGAPCPPSASPPRGSPACSLPPALSQAPVTAAPPAPRSASQSSTAGCRPQYAPQSTLITAVPTPPRLAPQSPA